MMPWMAAVACKAVLTAAAALPCKSLELDLTIADDGAWVLAHDPVKGTSEELKGKHQGFDDFVAGLKGKRFEHVNLDIKTRSFGFGRTALTGALERHAKSLETLAAQSDHLVASTPCPGLYEEVERWIANTKSKLQAGFELADYTAEDAKSWGLALPPRDAALLPLGRLANRVYLWWRGVEVRWLFVQERTALAMKEKPGLTIVCWSRDPSTEPPPPACRWTQRQKS